MEIENRGKGNGLFITIIVILLIAVIGLCSYIFLNKDSSGSTLSITENGNNNVKNNNYKNEPDNKENTQKSETNTQESTTQNTNVNTQNNITNSVVIFDGSKSINSDKKDYVLFAQGNASISAVVDSTQKVLTFSYNPVSVTSIYSLSWTSTNNEVSKSNINFDKKIVDIFFGGMGQSVSGDTLFILLEDGTVEYIPIVHMFNHAQGAPVSYGKISGVSEVTKFVMSNTQNSVTTLALKSDGTFYDLSSALKDTGNY